MHLTHLSAFFIAALFAFVTLCTASLPGNWPPLDKPPPIKPEWISLVNNATLPKAPVQKTAAGDCTKAAKFCIWSCNGCNRNSTDVIMCPDKKDWGISFDDGPSPYTPALLDYLKQTNTKITFAVVGSRVIERPEVLQRAVAEGHEVVVHTWSHPTLTTQSTEQIISEIKWTELAIQTAVGLTPKFVRPPGGDVDDRVRKIATQLGYKILMWDHDTLDWTSTIIPNFQPSWITNNFTIWVSQNVSNGHISLEHDLYPISAQTGPAAIDIVRNAGYTIKPVAVCNNMQPYVENVQLSASGPAPPTTAASSASSTATATATSTADAGTGAQSYSSASIPYLSSLVTLIALTISIAVDRVLRN